MISIILLNYVLVSIIVSLLFGMTVLSSLVIKKVFKKDFIVPYLFQIWSLILFITIGYIFKPELSIINHFNLLNWKIILLFIMAVIPTSIIVNLGGRSKQNSSIDVRDFFKGATMEIPQRLLVQNLLVLLCANSPLYDKYTLAIFLNALIWVQFIIVQEFINGNKISIAVLTEIVASLWFSIWVGILYMNTGNIIVPMLAHGTERILAQWKKQP